MLKDLIHETRKFSPLLKTLSHLTPFTKEYERCWCGEHQILGEVSWWLGLALGMLPWSCAPFHQQG